MIAVLTGLTLALLQGSAHAFSVELYGSFGAEELTAYLEQQKAAVDRTAVSSPPAQTDDNTTRRLQSSSDACTGDPLVSMDVPETCTTLYSFAPLIGPSVCAKLKADSKAANLDGGMCESRPPALLAATHALLPSTPPLPPPPTRNRRLFRGSSADC
jgi:hypothetical protein